MQSALSAIPPGSIKFGTMSSSQAVQHAGVEQELSSHLFDSSAIKATLNNPDWHIITH